MKVEKKTVNSSNKKNYKYLIILLIFFFIGMFFERFDLKNLAFNKLNVFYYETLNRFSSSFFSPFIKSEKIVIDINYSNFNKIAETRISSLANGRATEDIHKWVPAKIKYKKKNYKIKIKLKGVHSEHWEDPLRWSFNVKIDENKNILGLKKFSIQKVSTRDYLYEWLFMKALKNNGLISHRSEYFNVILNGNDLGLYYLEEVYSKNLIENNDRREGPIIGLDKNLWINEANNLNDLSINSLEESFWRAKIEPIQFDNDLINTQQEIYLNQAISQIESFRQNPEKIKEVFDIDQLSKVLALKTLFGAYEFDWKDLKFYYNPITKLLEPIIRELHLIHDKNQIIHWWSGSVFDENCCRDDQDTFLKLLFQNLDFYELYISELNNLVNNNFIEKLIEKNQNEFNKKYKLLKIYYPTNNIFSLNYLDNVKRNIKNILNPVQNLNAYFIKEEDQYFYFNVQNLQSLPVKIKQIITNDNFKIEFKNEIKIKGYISKKLPENNIVKVFCDNKQACNKLRFQNAKLIFSILGIDKEREANISIFYGDEKFNFKNALNTKNYETDDSLKKISLLYDINKLKKEINFKVKDVKIFDEVIIPKGYFFKVEPGTTITFYEKGKILSFSPISFIGTKENPIKINSFKKENLNSNLLNNNSITVLNAQNKSIIENCNFIDVIGPADDKANGISGFLNFYNSKVLIKDSIFKKNYQSDDFINIIKSDFEIVNTNIYDSFSDSIDFDFSNGYINNVNIYNAGNDAFDFSGSVVEIRNSYAEKVNDKVVSAGEKSLIKIINLSAKEVNVGIASKDLSQVEADNLEFNTGNIAITAYQKKIEFGPGKIEVKKSQILNFKNNYLREKNSFIFINNKEIDFTDYEYKNL